MTDLIGDLAAEQETLEAVVTALAEAVWDRPTPFYGWTIRDEICHLAFFDAAARLSATDAAAFAAQMDQASRDGDPFEETLKIGRALSTEALLDWWRRERSGLIDGLKALPPGHRLPWFGPPMGVRSFTTARLMETWAHGQDILDALGRERPATIRLRHIAHLGVSTRDWSFLIRGLPPPATPVRVELLGPSGEVWTWGAADAGEAIRGAAEDFCLVVTQRRHVDDTDLNVAGDGARHWMRIAQAFAGPPAEGPEPGAFPRRGTAAAPGPRPAEPGADRSERSSRTGSAFPSPGRGMGQADRRAARAGGQATSTTVARETPSSSSKETAFTSKTSISG